MQALTTSVITYFEMKIKTHVTVYLVLFIYVADRDMAMTKLSGHELTSVEECDLPKEVYEAVPIKHSVKLVTVRGKRTFQMNLTMAEKTLPLRTTVRVYKLVKNKKVIDHVVANLSCTNPIMSLLWRQLHFRHDRNCCMPPGVVIINPMNLDEFLHNPRKFAKLPDGTHIYDFQLHTKRGVMLCLSWRIEGIDH